MISNFQDYYSEAPSKCDPYYEECPPKCDPYYEDCPPMMMEGEEKGGPPKGAYGGPPNSSLYTFYPISPLMTVAAGIINYNEWSDLEGADSGAGKWKTAYFTEMGFGIWSLAAYGLTSMQPKLAALNIWMDVVYNSVNMWLVYRADDYISNDDSNSTTISYALHASAAVLSAAVAFAQMKELTTWLEGMKGGPGGPGGWGEKDGEWDDYEKCDPNYEDCPDKP